MMGRSKTESSHMPRNHAAACFPSLYIISVIRRSLSRKYGRFIEVRRLRRDGRVA